MTFPGLESFMTGIGIVSSFSVAGCIVLFSVVSVIQKYHDCNARKAGRFDYYRVCCACGHVEPKRKWRGKLVYVCPKCGTELDRKVMRPILKGRKVVDWELKAGG